MLDAVAFRALPMRDPASPVQVQLLENNQPIHISYPFYRELAARQQVLDELFAVSDFPLRQAVLRGRGSFRAVKGSIVTGNYFRVLGVNARAGRVFTEDDDRPAASPVIVLSDAFWNREFERSPSAIGSPPPPCSLIPSGISATRILALTLPASSWPTSPSNSPTR